MGVKHSVFNMKALVGIFSYFADGSFAALQGSQQQGACVTLTMCGAEVDTDRIKILGNRHLVNFHNR